ncbi:concanavalin A-like lectin/glucanase domain-containing protein [Dactylonectria estremocensis]|uniref:Concanavalin A-like lectin/glucanase domain-containing protein n=1 Tax=Dactylonectria estremocensis TaxID=1079267 RepID=A0A9P9EBP7_9HYPO|nr:concanavalin A-like lectin/glucanase domain-containing protein [Dactylonectria estremocensis]
MSCRRILVLLFSLLAVSLAWESPTYSGYTRIWQSTFIGKANSLPPASSWNFVTGDNNYNNESQSYSKNKLNIRQTSKQTLQLVPRKNTAALKGWTSARIESKYSFTPTAGKITRFESSLRLAGNAAKHKKGIWPAFWLLGTSCRNGGTWPTCGEVDIMENINGEKIGYASMHCDVFPGGICNESVGLSNSTRLADAKYHVWRVEFNRKSTTYTSQYITWYLDGVEFHRVTGAQIGKASVWKVLCQSPYYTILNVAVGGYWPGYPNANTWGGMGSMMEVGYIAHYVSK